MLLLFLTKKGKKAALFVTMKHVLYFIPSIDFIILTPHLSNRFFAINFIIFVRKKNSDLFTWIFTIQFILLDI